MKPENNTGIKRVFRAAGFSARGLKAAFVNEAAFRQEVALAALMLPLACWLEVTAVERLLLVATVFMVLIVELLNSAVEAVVDRIGPERHELSGRAKDIGSAAVFLALLLTAVVWGTILWPLLLA